MYLQWFFRPDEYYVPVREAVDFGRLLTYYLQLFLQANPVGI